MPPRHNPDASGKGPQARARVADAAARLILEHGISDYGHAKRKAAKQLGLPQGASLPSNEEVEQALIERSALFEPAEHLALVTRLRRQAQEVMQVFARFAPRLTGGLAVGAVSEHSAIELDIQAESSKEFEQFLVSQGIEFKILDRGGQMAYLIYAQPADVVVRLTRPGAHAGAQGARPYLTLDRLATLVAEDAAGG